MKKEIKWLYDMGLAIHWLYPKSKMPIGKNWQIGPRKSWEEIEHTFAHGQNVGVRTGEPSEFEDGTFLIILDIDVKSNDPEDAKLAYSTAETFLGAKLKKFPSVASGRGGYSLHIYARTRKPHSSFNLVRSPKFVTVKMPSIKPSKKEIEELTPEQIRDGLRIRPAFEIDVLGTGKQAAIPPSIHPDSGKPYKWKQPIGLFNDIPIVAEEKFKNANQNQSPDHKSFNFIEVDINELKLSNKAKSLIESMEGLESYGGDRSAALYAVIAEMALKEIPDDKIISVLSDPLNAIAEVVTDRVGADFDKAAAWLSPQIEKFKFEKSPERKFKDTEDVLLELDWGLSSTQDFEAAGVAVAEELEAWRTDLDKNQNGGVKMNLKNVSLHLRKIMNIENWLGLNLFTNEIEFIGAPPWAKDKKDIDFKGQMLTDKDVIEARLFLSRREKYEPTGHLMLEAMMSCAVNKAFHPVRAYLNTLEWDGIPRVENWLHSYLGADQSEYTKEVGKKLLLAGIARVMNPGCKFDHVVILEGKQGIGKSTAIRTLSEPWFCDSLGDITNKDVIQQMQGAWFIEIGELAAMDRATMNAFKDFITRREDKARLAYARLAQKFPRQCVFVGTTNDEEYLKDMTGNRRFWPVEVEVNGRVDCEQLSFDRDMIWAEAFQIYKATEVKLWLEKESVKAEHSLISDSKLVTDPWEEIVEEYVEMLKKEAQKKAVTPPSKTVTPVTPRLDICIKPSDIWVQKFGKLPHSASKVDQMRLAGILKKMKFLRKKTNGVVVWHRFL